MNLPRGTGGWRDVAAFLLAEAIDTLAYQPSPERIAQMGEIPPERRNVMVSAVDLRDTVEELLALRSLSVQPSALLDCPKGEGGKR